ncbi:MliC family protein [uncultured Alsobacter sp.]|uniref:MliC family protein n=1 Tax=uncultured Alsobacter sp. TaxID=1748258 RepID=UPI0025F49E2D|nr:MliC family protein [uncultured Alsobacter sp.]
MTARPRPSTLATVAHRRAAALAAFGLATLLATAAQATEARYTCSSGTTLKAVFSPPSAKTGRVTLTFGDGATLTLPQARSADGGRYAGKGTTFWIKGNAATLERKGGSETCTAQ